MIGFIGNAQRHLLAGLFLVMLLSGCGLLQPMAPGPRLQEEPAPVSDYVEPYRLQQGDTVIVKIRGSRVGEELQEIVDEFGNITLPYLNQFFVEGKTASELEAAIRRAYIEERIYKNITISVVIPGQEYFVRGEVRSPGRFQLSGAGLSLVQAVATAGGYTDFARISHVKILRGSRTLKANLKEMENDPDTNIMIEPGDVIIIPRKLF